MRPMSPMRQFIWYNGDMEAIMKKARIILSLILTMIIALQLAGPVSSVFAAVAIQPDPENLHIEAISNFQPAIGYNEINKYYADLRGDALTLPTNPPLNVTGYFLNYYLLPINKPYKASNPLELKESDVPASTAVGAENEMRMDELDSGTVYYAYTRAYYTYSIDDTSFSSAESARSNTVRFLTDIALNAYAYEDSQIMIQWDDVWNAGSRIDYKLYISENSSFTNTQPIYINEEDISSTGPVTVDESSGKLEYIHNVSDSGRVYYIKIVPDISDTGLYHTEESNTVTVSSYILATTTKMATTDDGTIWKMEWSPVVTGLSSEDLNITYMIYKGSNETGSLEQYMASTDDTVFYLTVTPEELTNYYIIRAIVTENGADIYPGIDIVSQKIFVKETAAPANPGVPELVKEFTNAGIPIISYEERLTSNSATLLWRTPKKGDGTVDTDMVYDIWLITDSSLIDDPPSSSLIASEVSMTTNNNVMSGTNLLGYKYVINGLTANSTYYFKIVAKKAYVEFVNNKLTTTMYESLPAIKIIITPASGPIDQPVVPNRPPFAIKITDGIEAVTGTSATVTLMNKWYEMYTTLSDGRGEWVYVTPEALDDIDDTLVSRLETEKASSSPDLLPVGERLTAEERLLYRIVEYDGGVTIDVGCIEYVDGFDYSTLETLTADRITGFPVTANDTDEVITDAGSIRDGKKHNLDITIEGLEPNMTYIIWLRAARRTVSLISGPSDPIIVTTNPDLLIPLEKPTVPLFNYYEAADTYVNLGWTTVANYNYYLKYSTTDDIESASDSIEITADELIGTSYYKLSDLTPSTIYYFWIQAEASNAAGETSRSEWSDSLILKTKAYMPPETPKGFGVKNSDDAVTKNSITYEWIMIEGLEYILEVATDINYTDAKVYEAGEVSEYTVSGLRSNLRYYARLYAYDPEKELKSNPTQSVIVRTERSQDDYDSDQDVENVLSGDFIVIDYAAVNHIWSARIVGINAERFINHVQNDRKLDYLVDLTDAPSGTQIVTLSVSGKVLRALSAIGENLLIKTDKNTIVVRPGVFITDNVVASAVQSKETVFAFHILLEGAVADTDTTNLALKTSATQLSITEALNGSISEINKFEKPLKVVYEYSSVRWYTEGLTSGYILPEEKVKWIKKDTTATFDPDNSIGYLSFEAGETGRMAVAEPGENYFDDTSKHWARTSINNVASVHEIRVVTDRTFEPEKYVTNGDAVKFMLDMIDYSYGSNYLNVAVKAGLLSAADAVQPSVECTREKLVSMTIRIYELKSSEKAVASRDDTGVYKDASEISSKYLPKIKYAVENGIIISRFSNVFGPKDPITRGELMILLEKLLVFSGEL